MDKTNAKKPDYTDFDWTALIADRTSKWEEMWKKYAAQGLNRVPIQPGGHSKDPFIPQLLIYPVLVNSNAGTLIICAGGGFMFKSSNEAGPVADFFYQRGINVAILDYYTDSQKGMGSIDTIFHAGNDGLRAIKFLRYHSAEMGINPDRIAIGGFSAGGMLSMYTATHFDYGNPSSADPVDRISSRPDAVVMVYSAFSSLYASHGGAGMFSFDKQKEAVRGCMDIELRNDCPPFFITQTCADDPRDAYYLGMELTCRGIPHEIHIYEEGPHGGGLFDGKDADSPLFQHTSSWSGQALEWLRMRGY